METFNGSNVTVGADTCTLFTSKAKCYAVWAPPRIAGVASMISCVIIVIILVALKKYKFLPQRLILYLTVAVFFNTVHALWGDFHLSNRANDGELIGFCIFQGFYHILTAWISFLWVCIITFSIVWTTVALKRTGKKFEYAYFAVALIPPVIISIIPFTVEGYGPAGIWCWLRPRKDGERYEPGIILQFVLEWKECTHRVRLFIFPFDTFYGPWMLLYTVMAVILISVSSLIYYRRRKAGEHGGSMAEVQQNLWKEEIKPLMPFPWIFISCYTFPFINRIRLAAGLNDPDSDAHFAFWFLHAAIVPLPGFLFALVIISDKKTRKDFKQVLSGWCKTAKNNPKTCTKTDEAHPPENEAIQMNTF